MPAQALADVLDIDRVARPDARMDALRDEFGSLMVFDDVNRYLRGMLAGLDIRYRVGGNRAAEPAGIPDTSALRTALTTWFGPPRRG
ncbi:hypothetical protein ACWGR4_26480 [Embleya sp. NPDC055664]